VRRTVSIPSVALLVGLLAACGGGGSDSSAGLPEVSGEYGTKPKVTVAKGVEAGKTLESEVLTEGDGAKVEKGDLLVADYLGKIYGSGGKVFDNSYDRGAPAAFTLTDGPGGVIPGWVKGLQGVNVGSRVLLVAPPKDGYGKQGNPQAGIKGTDSLVFVVDVIAAYNESSPLPESTPVADLPEDLPAVTGETEPTISVAKGTTPPAEPETTVLAAGTGPEVEGGKLGIVQFAAVDWTGEALSSTWVDDPEGAPAGPQGVSVGGQQPSPFDLLVGIPVGSRVLLELPAQEGADPAKESVAVVIDVLAQHGPAKDSKGGSK
jgi:peptidylprolyl isomerase